MAQVSALILEAARLAVWLVILTAIFVPLERLFALRPQKVWRPQALNDLGYYLLGGFTPILLLGAPMALVAAIAERLVPGSWRAAVGALPLAVRLVLGLAVGEIGFYWGHRLSHGIPWLWRFHAVHHSAEHMDFLVNTRAHPVDLVFTRLCGLVPLVVLGLSGPGAGNGVAALVMVVAVFWGFFIHANLRWRLGPLEWLVATPVFHHWHHSRAEHLDRNFASMLPALDVMFGTLHLPKGEWPKAYGVETPLEPTLLGQLIEPLAPARRPRAVIAD